MADSGVRVDIDAAQLKKLGNGEQIRQELRKKAAALVAKANATLHQSKNQNYPDYYYVVTKSHEPPYAKVYTRSNHAKYSNARNQTLAKLA